MKEERRRFWCRPKCPKEGPIATPLHQFQFFHMICKLMYTELKMLVLSGIKGTIQKQDNAMYEIYFYENTINSLVQHIYRPWSITLFPVMITRSHNTILNPSEVPAIDIHSKQLHDLMEPETHQNTGILLHTNKIACWDDFIVLMSVTVKA